MSFSVNPWGWARSERKCLGFELHRMNLAEEKLCLAYGVFNSSWMSYLLKVMFKVPHGPLTCRQIFHLSWKGLTFLWCWIHVCEGRRSTDDTHARTHARCFPLFKVGKKWGTIRPVVLSIGYFPLGGAGILGTHSILPPS